MSSKTQDNVVDEGASHLVAKAIRQVRRNLVAYLALFIAIGGTAMAAKPLVTGADIEDDSVTGADVDESSLGTVPRATDAVYAENAGNASNLGNQLPSAFAPSAAEAFHAVGAAGEPEFLNGWANLTPGFTTAAFYKDPWGVVHLKGMVHRDTSEPTTIFILPEGYRPAEDWTFPQPVFIGTGGAVASSTAPANFANLNGIAFRAAH